MTETNTKLVLDAFPNCTISKTGIVTVKQSYFYRHNGSPEKLADLVLRKFPTATILDKQDKYAAWPKTSYFIVKFTIKGK